MKRLKEVDAIRGLAIVLMIIFHFAFDLDFLGIKEIHVYEGGWAVLRRTTQFLFLGVVGFSVFFSRRDFKGQLKRGAFIFLMGMLVTFATWIALGDGFVKFGILHLIGVAVPIVVLFKGHKLATFFAAVSIIAIGIVFGGMTTDLTWLFPIGLPGPGFYSLDYFPIFPWLAVPLTGLLVAQELYIERKATRLKNLAKVPGLTFMGRHSLLIYLIHQPIIYFSLLLLQGVYS